MALFGPLNTGQGQQVGFFGQRQDAPRFPPIFGIGSGLIAASFDASLSQSALRNLSPQDRAAQNFRGDAAVVPPWLQESEERSLNSEIRDIRALSSFIDTDFEAFREAEGDVDSQATFVIFRALERLRSIAEFAGRDDTPESSLDRLDELFQRGFEEVRNYITDTQLSRLDLFLGDKQSDVETTARLGRDTTSYDGNLVSADPNAAIAGLTGTEVFTITLIKNDLNDNVTDSDDFTIDLSNIAGDLSLNNVSAYINSQIQALQATDTNGDLVFDNDGNAVAKYFTRFNVERDFDARQSFLSIDSSLVEDVQLSAQAYTPSVFVASSVTPIGVDQTTTARVSEVSGLDGELSVSTLQTFSGIDLAATELAEATADGEESTSVLNAEQAALRDQFRQQAREAVLSEVQLDAFEDEQRQEAQAGRAITDVDDEFRVNADTGANAVATDSQGNVFVVGNTAGTFGNQINTASENDVFLTKFDSTGNVIFSRLLGSTSDSSGFAVTVDDQDNVIVAGQTDNKIDTGDVINSTDSFVVKYDNVGNERLRYQLDTASTTAGLSLTTTASTVDGNGNTVDGDIILGGYTSGRISSTSGFGGTRDGLLLRIDGTTGTLEGSNVFGGASAEEVRAIEIASDGNLLVASEEGGSAVLRKFDINDLSSQLYSQNLGLIGGSGSVEGLAVDGTSVYVAGVTNGQTPTSSGAATLVGGLSGGEDAFVAGFTDNGGSVTANFTTILGTGSNERVADVVASGGSVFVAGSTLGTLSGEADQGARDGFVARINGTTGALENTEQFGQTLSDIDVRGAAFATRGDSVLDVLGLPSGEVNPDIVRTVQSQTAARVGDYFDLRVEDGRRTRTIRIELEEGDTFEDLERAIRTQAFRDLTVETRSTSEGDSLKISALNEAGSPNIELIAGEDGRDLLSRLGIAPGRLVPRDEALGLRTSSDAGDNASERERQEATLGGAFGLRLEGALNVGSRSAARFVQGELDGAISQIQRAFRSLTFNPFRDQLTEDRPGNNDGQPSARTLGKIANFTSALQRLQAGQAANPGVSLFI